jgi:hypothetical protein
MFSTQQLKLRNQVAEIRSMLPEFAEEDRPDILEVIQKLVSKFKYTFPEEIWKIIKEYMISPKSNWCWTSKLYSSPNWYQNYLPLRKLVREDLKKGTIFVMNGSVNIIERYSRGTMDYYDLDLHQAERFIDNLEIFERPDKENEGADEYLHIMTWNPSNLNLETYVERLYGHISQDAVERNLEKFKNMYSKKMTKKEVDNLLGFGTHKYNHILGFFVNKNSILIDSWVDEFKYQEDI